MTDILDVINSYGGIGSAITIPSAVLNFTTYTFGLKLTNFLGVSSVRSVKVFKSRDGNIPTVAIVGSSYVVTTPDVPFSMVAQGLVSKCASSPYLFYSWKVFSNNLLTSMVTQSKDPRLSSSPRIVSWPATRTRCTSL